MLYIGKNLNFTTIQLQLKFAKMNLVTVKSKFQVTIPAKLRKSINVQKVGIHHVYISQIETGKRTGSAKTLARIAEVLNIDIDELI